MAIRTIAIVGANGTLGTQLLSSLLQAGTFDVTVIKRAGSASPPPPDARIATVDAEFSFDSLVEALKGQDAAIAAFPLRDPDAHLRLARAAAAAGVKLYVPADFGSIDAENPRARELVALYRHKLAVRELCQQLAEAHAHFSWTGVVCGHFFEWGLREHLFHADLQKRTIEILDGGRHRASATTLPRVGEAVVRILNLHGSEAIRNRTLFLQSFCITQLELVRALEKGSGAKWTVKDTDSETFIEERRAKADAGDFMAIEDLVFAIGTLHADWTGREDFAMDLLGFEDEDLDAVVASVLAQP
ncbi:nmrA-like family protein [Colletotrichum plurivorum]|uniref:NmrA-like family protein n=1 Tax=Colletotrichum plurivorum TaxID=2175906 RepID=A0A8H6K0U2_9PEZI|nr:nmrA-like family protein [Colletotrichum plurivorum]